MRCSYKPQANRLGSILYCLLTLLITSYLLYLGIRRYFTSNNYDYYKNQGNVYSVISVALHGFAMVMVPFFIAACCCKVGNLASDGDRLGERTQKVVDVLAGTPVCRKLKSAWQHGPPVAQTIHLSIAFALLMAHTLVETQFFKHGSSVIETDDIWSTDVEFLYNNRESKLSQLMHNEGSDRSVDPEGHHYSGYQRHHYPRSYQSPDYDSDRLSYPDPLNDPNGGGNGKLVSSADVSPKVLPLLTTFRQYGISLLFFNYAIALFIYASAYPSVFWRANKAFSLVFCSHLLLHAVDAVFSFVGFVILYRFQVSNSNRPPFILNEYLLVTIYVASCTILFSASSVVYGYGYNKYCLRLLSTAGNGRGQLSRFRGTKVHPICCEGYCPHIAAILMLILMVAAKAPVLYDQMILYQKAGKPITMVCIVSDVVYLFAWILLWLGLTLKRDWAFKVRYTNSEIGALLGLQTDTARPVNDNTMIVVCGENCFATDDERKRTALLQLAEKCGLGQQDEEVYWLKPSHTTTNTDSDGKQSAAAAPELNNLLGGSSTTGPMAYQPPQQHYHQHPVPHNKAATIGVSGGNYYKKYGGARGNGPSLGYSKVSFSDCEPESAPYSQIRQQEHRLGPTRGSGSYVRFNDDQSGAGLNYDDSAAVQDIVSTFGTLPRQDYPRRRMVHDNGGDIFAQQTKPPQQPQVQTLASVGGLKRTPSPMCPQPPDSKAPADTGDQPPPGFLAYASVHKRNISPVQRSAEYGRLIHPQPQHPIVPNMGDSQPESENISRVSSYANLPNSSKQNWDAASLSRVDASRPPVGRTAIPPGQQQQQYHHHQHHYVSAGSNDSSPSCYSTLPNVAPIGGVNAMATPQTSQNRRHHVHYKPTNGPDMTVTVQPKTSPKNSPNLESDYYSAINGQGRKLTSFSNSSSASGPGMGVESTDITPTQQMLGLLTGPTPGPMATSSGSSGREMTPLSNGNGGMKPGSVPGPSVGGNWRLNTVYGPQANVPGPSSRSQTPQGGNYGVVNSTALPAQPQQGGNLGIVYYDTGNRGGGAGPSRSGYASSKPSAGNGGRTLLALETNDRNDSANFSLTSSSNESDNNQFVTSIV